MRSCYDCTHINVCKFYDAISAAITRNLGMVDVDQPTSSPSSFIHIHETVATVCTMFKANK